MELADRVFFQASCDLAQDRFRRMLQSGNAFRRRVVMSAQGLESIDRTVQLTHIWINDLDARLGWENRYRAYRLLRTVLQTLRDC